MKLKLVHVLIIIIIFTLGFYYYVSYVITSKYDVLILSGIAFELLMRICILYLAYAVLKFLYQKVKKRFVKQTQ